MASSARIIQSAPTHRAFMTRKQWQHPSRREHIHNKVQGLPDRRDPTAKWFIALAVVVAAFFALQLLRPNASARGNAASSAHPLAEGSTAVLLDAKDGKR